jgi:hypothetical protein
MPSAQKQECESLTPNHSLCTYSLRGDRFDMMGDFFQRPGFLNVSGEKGNGIGAYDGQGEPDDASEWPAETVLLPHGDQQVNDAG